MHGDHEKWCHGLAEAWRRVTRQGVPVLVLRDNPAGRRSRARTRSSASREVVRRARRTPTCALDRHDRLDRWFDALSLAARRTPGAQMIDLTPFYCDEDTCPVVIGGVNVYRDNNHVTVTYAKTLAPYLYRAIVENWSAAAQPHRLRSKVTPVLASEMSHSSASQVGVAGVPAEVGLADRSAALLEVLRPGVGARLGQRRGVQRRVGTGLAGLEDHRHEERRGLRMIGLAPIPRVPPKRLVAETPGWAAAETAAGRGERRWSSRANIRLASLLWP